MYFCYAVSCLLLHRLSVCLSTLLDTYSFPCFFTIWTPLTFRLQIELDQVAIKFTYTPLGWWGVGGVSVLQSLISWTLKLDDNHCSENTVSQSLNLFWIVVG